MWPHKPIQGTPVISGHSLAPNAGFWLFNEGMGDKVSDLSGNGNDGTFSGDVSWVRGERDPALDFPGTNDYITIPDNPSLDVTAGITIIAKIYQHSHQHRFVDRYTNPYSYGLWDYWDSPQDTFRFGLYIAGGHRALDDVTTSPLNEWVVVAGTYDSSIMRLYKNGVEVNNVVMGGPIQSGSGSEVVIGARAQDYTEDFDGLIEYVYLYNRALSAAEIAEIYSNPYAMFAIPDIAWMYPEAPPAANPYYYQQLLNRRYAA